MFFKNGINKIKTPFKYLLNDELLVMKSYYDVFQKDIDLFNPKTFNEKIQFLKLYNRNADLNSMADKYKVREFVEKKVGKKFLNDLYGVYDNPDDIDFAILPNQFVIKCNHSWGTNIICLDKEKLDIAKTKSQLRTWLKQEHYPVNAEWAYKEIEPKITVEKFLGEDVRDIKVFCFDGKPKYVEVDSNRSKVHLLDIYDIEWQRLNVKKGNNSNHPATLKKPRFIEELLDASIKLSGDQIFCRVDFLATDEIYKFCELTFYPGAGLSGFEPESFDLKFGADLNIESIRISRLSRIKIRIISNLLKLRRKITMKQILFKDRPSQEL